jgi:antitoxin FitA
MTGQFNEGGAGSVASKRSYATWRRPATWRNQRLTWFQLALFWSTNLNSSRPDTSDAIIDSMAQLIVRNLDEEIVTRLRQRAAKHRRSTEAEHREILREVLLLPRSRSSLKEHLLAMPDAGTDRDFERPPDRPRKRVKL